MEISLDRVKKYLDTRSIESIEEALESFKGTILFISHDRYFINKISNRVIAIEDKLLKSYSGNYDYYRSIKDKERQLKEELRLRAEEAGRINRKPDNTNQSGKAKKPVNNKHGSGRKHAGNPVKTAKAEKRIADIEKELQEIEDMMNAMSSDYEELSKLYERKEDLSKELEKAMEDWLGFN